MCGHASRSHTPRSTSEGIRQHPSAYANVCTYVSWGKQTDGSTHDTPLYTAHTIHTSAYVTSAYVGGSTHYTPLYTAHTIHTSVYVSIRQHTSEAEHTIHRYTLLTQYTPLHTSAYVSIRQHTSEAAHTIHRYTPLTQDTSASLACRTHVSTPTPPLHNQPRSTLNRALIGPQ